MKRKFPAYAPVLLAIIGLLAFGAVNALASSKLETIFQSLGGGTASQVKDSAGLSSDPSVTPTAGDEVHLTGTIVSIGTDFWMIDSYKVVVDTLTKVEGMPAVGDKVNVEAVLQADGSYVALEIELAQEPTLTPGPSGTPSPSQTPESSRTPYPSRTPAKPHGNEFEYFGVLTSISADSWVVGDFTFKVTAQTHLVRSPAVGDRVHVNAVQLDDQTYWAKEINVMGKKGQGTPEVTTTPEVTGTPEPSSTPAPGKEVELTGKVDAIAADAWVVNGQTVLVNNETEIEAGIMVGDMVKVEAVLQADNSYLALEIDKVEAEVSKTPNPSATPGTTETMMPSATPGMTATNMPTDMPGSGHGGSNPGNPHKRKP